MRVLRDLQLNAANALISSNGSIIRTIGAETAAPHAICLSKPRAGSSTHVE